MMTLLQLNDDCLEDIFKFLDMQQQITVKNVCCRLENIIKSLWRHQWKSVELEEDHFKQSENINKDFFELMSIISDYVEELNYRNISVAQIKLLQGLKFPKLISLDYDNYTKDINDEDILVLTKIFPDIQKLTLLTAFTGKYIWNMSNLVELDLSCCEFLETKCLERIFTTLKLRKFYLLYYGYNTLLSKRISTITKCKTLEEIKIDDHHLILFIDDLLKMPKMRKIICYTRDYDEYIMEKIADIHGLRMDTIVYNDVFWGKNEHVKELVKMKNLRKLILKNDDIDEYQLQTIAANLTNLRDFYFLKCRPVKESCLLSVVEQCNQLELMDITNTSSVTPAFLVYVIDAVRKQYNRRAPLQLRCYDTGITAGSLENLELPNHLRVSLEKRAVELELPYSRCFQCEWVLDS